MSARSRASNLSRYLILPSTLMLYWGSTLVGCSESGPTDDTEANGSGGSVGTGATTGSGGTGAETGTGGADAGSGGASTGGANTGGTTATGGSGTGGGGGGEPDFNAISAALYQTSKAGDKRADKGSLNFTDGETSALPVINVNPGSALQTIIGFGGSLTEASATALAGLPAEKRTEIINAHFGSDGAAYSLARTHIGSCDFSVGSYSYAPEEDATLANFSIAEDEPDLIPLIKDAMAAPGADFKLMASPWSAPPWMKANNAYFGGQLKAEHYATFALYISKYIEAYKAQGIDVWAITPENEPLGNGAQWESMEFTPSSMLTYIKDHLGPQLEKDGHDVDIVIFDQNRDHVLEWTNAILGTATAAKYVAGTGVHWYSSTVNVYEDTLDQVHANFPEKYLIHTEGTIDQIYDSPSEDPNTEDSEPGLWWMNDTWWWEKNATDWGYIWAEDKSLHPIYTPVYRYARDLVIGLNHWMSGWIDWNIVLDSIGGPNHVGNYCGAGVMVDPETDEVHYTPVFYVMSHFSKFIRPGAQVLTTTVDDASGLIATSALNPDGTIAVQVVNDGAAAVDYRLQVGSRTLDLQIPDNALQTLVVSQ